MKKLLKIVELKVLSSLVHSAMFIAIFICSNQEVNSQEVSVAIAERLKEQLLVEIVPTLDLREGGMCFFYPQGKNFVTKVAINCSRLFDSLLEDLVQEKSKSSLFEPELYVRIKESKNQKALLEILQSDLQIFREIRQKEGGFATEKLGLATVEIAKISQYFFRQNVELSSEILLGLRDVLGRFAEDVVLIVLTFDAEESVSKMTSGLWDNREFIEKTNVENQLLIELFLNVVKGNTESVIQSAINFYDLFEQRSVQIVENYSTYVPNSRQKNFEIVKQVIALLEDCKFSPNNIASNSCEQNAREIGYELEEEVSNRYYLNLGKWFASLPENEVLTAVNPSLIKYRNLSVSSRFIDDKLKPVLGKLKLRNEVELNKACVLLGESPCSLEIEINSNLTILRNLIVLLVIALLGYVGVHFLKRRPKKAKAPCEEKNSDELSANERSELRELRNYFNLKPFDNVNELHKSYRKMVFAVHPDKLRDGGKEFVVLQANYLKAKTYLDKLEQVREKKVSNS